MIMLLSIGRKVGLSFVSPSAADVSGTGVGVAGGVTCAINARAPATAARARAREKAFNRIVSPLRETSGARLGEERRSHGKTHEIFRLPSGASRTSRTLRASASGVKGFARKAVSGSRIPCCVMAASV